MQQCCSLTAPHVLNAHANFLNPQLHSWQQIGRNIKVFLCKTISLNIFYCHKKYKQLGWATSSSNISYGPPHRQNDCHLPSCSFFIFILKLLFFTCVTSHTNGFLLQKKWDKSSFCVTGKISQSRTACLTFGLPLKLSYYVKHCSRQLIPLNSNT